MKTSVVERFLRYVTYDTQSDENSESYPSTEKQLVLLRDLVSELKAIGLSDAAIDEHGYVFATIPATSKKPDVPVIGLIGAPLFTSWIIGYIFGVTEGGTAWHAIGVAPIFVWELALGLWMTFKGFNRNAPIVASAIEDATRPGIATANAPTAAAA